MIRAALGMTAVFLLLHLCGGRDSVGLLSGTLEGGSAGLVFGIAYALSWFSAVLLAPVLLLAGLADAALARYPLLCTMGPREAHPWSEPSAGRGSPSARSTPER